MGAIDLTTLASVRGWLGIDPSVTSDDALLQRLITSMSAKFEQLVGRDILRKTYVETLDGSDLAIRVRQATSPWVAGQFSGGGVGVFVRGWALNLQNWPVIAMTSVVIDGQSIPQGSNPNQATQVDGWVLKESYRLELLGPTYGFTEGIQNVVLTYDAGYFVSGEAATIPATPYQVQTQQTFVADYGVTFTSNGAALTKVPNSPAAGQYSVSATGQYTFAAADSGKGIAYSYAAIPPDVEQAVIDMVAWQYRSKARIGEKSKSIGEGTVMFAMEAIPPTSQAVIDSWRRPQV